MRVPKIAIVEPRMARGRIGVRKYATLARMITTLLIVLPTASAATHG